MELEESKEVVQRSTAAIADAHVTEEIPTQNLLTGSLGKVDDVAAAAKIPQEVEEEEDENQHATIPRRGRGAMQATNLLKVSMMDVVREPSLVLPGEQSKLVVKQLPEDTKPEFTEKKAESASEDQSMASVKAKARRERGGGQRFQHLTPAARPGRASSEGSQPITTTSDTKARARKERRGMNQQNVRPGAFAVGPITTTENVTDEEGNAGDEKKESVNISRRVRGVAQASKPLHVSILEVVREPSVGGGQHAEEFGVVVMEQPDDAKMPPSKSASNLKAAPKMDDGMVVADSLWGGVVQEEPDDEDSNVDQNIGHVGRLKAAPGSVESDETANGGKSRMTTRVRLADVSTRNVQAVEPERHSQRMRAEADEAQAPKSNLKTPPEHTATGDESLASMKTKAKQERSCGQKQQLKHLTPAARPGRAKSEGSQPITTTADMKARARRERRGLNKQDIRPGAVAVGPSTTAESAAEQDDAARVHAPLKEDNPQQFQHLRSAAVATVRAVSDGSTSTERRGDGKARARQERQAAGLESVRPGAVAVAPSASVEATEEIVETDQREAASKAKPGFLPPSVAARQARHRDRKMREKEAAFTQEDNKPTETQSGEELENDKANDDGAASQTDRIQEKLATYDELDDFQLAKKASINAMPTSTARWSSDDNARSKAGSRGSVWVSRSSRSGRSDRRRGSSNTFGRGGGSGDFLVEATLVTDLPSNDVENTGRDIAPAATVVVAEQVKKSWYSNRKVQCVFVILLLAAIGVIAWIASRPSPALELVLVSSSPSVSMYPSMSPTTGVPSSIPSLNPTQIQIKTVTAAIRFDRFPSEIGWRLEDACGIVEEVQPGIYSGPQYIEAVERINFDLNVGITYTFTVLDSYGDGLGCGSVSLTLDEDGSKLAEISASCSRRTSLYRG